MKRLLITCALAVLAAGATGPASAATKAGPYYGLPAWDQKIPAASRFVILSDWNKEAVLDRETGLVWQRTAKYFADLRTAFNGCANAETGGRMGWRMPRYEELASLIDPAQTAVVGKARLPAGHPFTGIDTYRVFLTSEHESLSTYYTTFRMDYGRIDDTEPDFRNTSGYVLCVRGGAGTRQPL